MGKKFQDEKILDNVDEDKRDFIRKVVVGTVFAVPVVNSFSMDGLKIDLKAKMARADEYDQPGGYDEVGGGGYASDAVGKGKGKGKIGS